MGIECVTYIETRGIDFPEKRVDEEREEGVAGGVLDRCGGIQDVPLMLHRKAGCMALRKVGKINDFQVEEK